MVYNDAGERRETTFTPKSIHIIAVGGGFERVGRLLTTWESIFRLTELELERLLAEETCVVTTRGEQQSARSKPRDGGSPKCRVQATSNVWT